MGKLLRRRLASRTRLTLPIQKTHLMHPKQLLSSSGDTRRRTARQARIAGIQAVAAAKRRRRSDPAAEVARSPARRAAKRRLKMLTAREGVRVTSNRRTLTQRIGRKCLLRLWSNFFGRKCK